MNLLPYFEWLGSSPVGQAMQSSPWAFIAVESVHLLAMAGLGGAALVLNLKLSGAAFATTPLRTLARSLNPLAWISFAAMVVSGVLLVSAEAARCYENPVFRWKMLLIALAVGFQLTVHRRAIARAADSGERARWVAGISLALWLSAGVAGRAIGLI